MGNIKQFKPTEPPSQGIEKYPDTCQVYGCGKPTDVVFSMAHNQSTGKRVCGNYVDLKNGAYVAQTGYIFKGWVTRCCTCYAVELQAKGKSAITCANKNRLERERIFGLNND